MNKPEDVKEILGTRAFQKYVDTPIQTLDQIVVSQAKHFLPLAQEAKKIAEEIKCKVQPHCASLGYPFYNMAAHTEATPTREGI